MSKKDSTNFRNEPAEISCGENGKIYVLSAKSGEEAPAFIQRLRQVSHGAFSTYGVVDGVILRVTQKTFKGDSLLRQYELLKKIAPMKEGVQAGLAKIWPVHSGNVRIEEMPRHVDNYSGLVAAASLESKDPFGSQVPFIIFKGNVYPFENINGSFLFHFNEIAFKEMEAVHANLKQLMHLALMDENPAYRAAFEASKSLALAIKAAKNGTPLSLEAALELQNVVKRLGPEVNQTLTR